MLFENSSMTSLNFFSFLILFCDFFFAYLEDGVGNYSAVLEAFSKKVVTQPTSTTILKALELDWKILRHMFFRVAIRLKS